MPASSACGNAVAKLLADQGDDVRSGRQGAPLVRQAADVHQDGAAGVRGDGGGHGGVPGEAADIVDDFGPGFEGAAGDRWIYRCRWRGWRWGAAPDGLDDGQNAVDFLLGGDGSGERGSLVEAVETPGRVDSPPMSRMSAPWSSSSRPWAMAACGMRKRPPSEKESGVTLSTPMMRVRSPERKRAAADVPLEAGAHERALYRGRHLSQAQAAARLDCALKPGQGSGVFCRRRKDCR